MNVRPPIVTLPIKIAQINIQRKKHATIQLLNNNMTEFDIILIQEPAWSFIGRNPTTGKEINGPVALRGWSTILPVTAMNETSPRPRTLTYYRPRPDFSITLRSDLIEDRDIQILDIYQLEQPTVTVINIYNDSPSGDQCILNRLRQENNILPQHAALITGDFNLHHPTWSREDRTLNPDQLASNIADWLAQSNYSLLNEKGEVTHLARHAGERPSVIDLSFANATATRLDTFKDWSIDPSISHDSDHNAIKFTIDNGRKEIDNILGTKYNISKIDPEEWARTFDLELDKVKVQLNLINENNNPSEEQLDAYAETLSQAIQNTISLTAKERRPSNNAKPWWDQDLSEAAKRVSNARSLHQEYQKTTGEFNPNIQADITRSRNFFKRLCKFKKKTWAIKVLEDATTKDIWSFPKWSKGTRVYPTPPISQGPDQPKATTHEDKCEALRRELYQPPPNLEHNFNPDVTSRLIDDLPFTDITPEEVRDAIFKSKSNSAPGHSQISYQVLKWAWSNDTGQIHIISLMQKCLRKGYHPKSWRKAIAVAIPKPNKPDYSNPRAYRLITLLECLAKVLERIVANRLTFIAGSLNLIPPNQFGGRSNSSTDDAIMTFVTDVQTAWNNGKVTSALTFDIKGYFDFVNHDRLLHELRRKHLPLEYIKWTHSFLSDREAAICIDGKCGQMSPVENGIPQGSPVSPVMASFYSAELIEKFKIPAIPEPDRITFPSQPTPTNIIMYVDDGKIYVSSKSLETNTIILRLAYLEVETWLKSAGLASDLTKREIMHYSRRRKYDCCPSLTILDHDGITRTIVLESTVKWLGVHFDRKLRFQHHVKTAAAKGENAVNALKMLSNTVRGLSQVHLRRLYLSCITTKMLYACPAWWNNTKCQAKPLEKVQRNALRLICAAFRTTPTLALEVEASVPPLKHQADLISRRYATRLNKLPDASPIIQRLPEDWRNNTPPVFPPPIPTEPTSTRKPITNLKKIAKHTDPGNERIDPFSSPPWQRTLSLFPNRFITNPCTKNTDTLKARDEHKKLFSEYQRDPNVLCIYTDGSKINRSGFFRIGAAATAFHGGREVSFGKLGLGGHAEVFDAEMAALSIGATKADEYLLHSPNISHIAFFTDNAATITAITDPKPKTSQFFALKFHQTIRPLLTNHENLKVSISWCPSHCGISGNERADKLAKEATELERQTPFSATYSNARRRAKTSSLKMWQIDWKNSPKVGRYAIANRFKPSLNPTPHFKNLKSNREIFGRVIQCRTGHSYTGEFRRSFLPLSQDPITCPCDNETLETREHILRECVRFDRHRDILEKVSSTIALPEILGSKEGIAALSEFLKKSSAFTRTGSIPTKVPQPTFENEPEQPINEEPRFEFNDGG